MTGKVTKLRPLQTESSADCAGQPFAAGSAFSELHPPASQGSGGIGAFEHMLETQVMTTGAELQLSGVQIDVSLELLIEL